MNIIELMLIYFSKYIRKRGNRIKIFLDAGHSDGGDAGVEGFNLREQDITFGIVMHLIKKLLDVGFEIMVSRENVEDVLGENVSTSLSKRISLANTWGADVFISIHCNASANSTANGTEAYTFNTSGKALSLAKKIQSKIVEILGTTDRGTKTANLLN
ncbi:MAG: N-acetylmuramoyl-L-alanine amidase [Ruminococcaceae bacterium]|nr:N-acetylmuramoyl-L-alanine amidase [Oscillospiraceae bacterium]